MKTSNLGTQFTEKNIVNVIPSSSICPKYKKIYLDTQDLVYSPTESQKRGLQQAVSGYGSNLNSGYMINFCGKLRRVYAICYSNASTMFFRVKGEMIIVG